MNSIVEVLAALIPSLGVGVLFWLAIRALLNADRTERAALARMDAQEHADRGAAIPGPADSDS